MDEFNGTDSFTEKFLYFKKPGLGSEFFYVIFTLFDNALQKDELCDLALISIEFLLKGLIELTVECKGFKVKDDLFFE